MHPDLRVIAGGLDPHLRRRRAERRAQFRRRRLAVTLAATVIAIVVWLAVVGAASLLTAAGGDGPAPITAPVAGGSTASVHVVRPGDTLWSIARDLAPDGEVRPFVDRLADRAGGPALQPGQRIDLDGLVG